MNLKFGLMLGAASLAAGAINSVAGGGSLLAFPMAMASGMPPIVANATNSVGLMPGSLASAWAYRREVVAQRAALTLLFTPAVVGSLTGAALLMVTPQKYFDAAVPLLLLFATLLLVAQNLRGERAPKVDDAGATIAAPFHPGTTGVVMQFLVSVYGGYFGAGMGIMMLALYEGIGGGTLNERNAVKTTLAGVINVAASAWFLASGLVNLPAGAVMAVASTIGGLAGAALARKADPRVVRWVIGSIGLGLTGVTAWQRWL